MSKRFFLIISLCLCQAILSVDIGSDVTVTNFITPQFVGNGDRIANLAFVRGGLIFEGINTTATWDSHFAFSGPLVLNGGTAILDNNIFIQQPSSVINLGNVVGNAHRIEFSPAPQVVPSIAQPFISCGMLFVDSITLDSPINSVDWTEDDIYLAVGLQTNMTSVVRIYQANEAGFTLTDEAQLDGQTVNVVRFHPTQEYLTVGTVDNVGGGELYLFDFDSVTGTLSQLDEKEISAGVRSMSWHQIDGSFIALGVSDTTQEIQLWSFDENTAQFSASPVASIDLLPNRLPSLRAMDWNLDGRFLAVGLDAVAGQDSLLTYEFDETTTTLTFVTSAVTGTAVTALEWNTTDTNIIGIGLDSGSDLLRVYELDSTTSVLTQLAQVADLEGSIIALDWERPNGQCVVIGKLNNDDTGSLQVYYFDTVTNQLIETSDIIAAAGLNATRWSHDGHFIASGDVASVLSLYESADDYFGTTCLIFSDVDIVFNDVFTVNQGCIKYKGDCLIDSTGHDFVFGPDYTTIIGSNASLVIHRQKALGLSGMKIQCQDMTSTLSLSNVTLFLDDDFTFTQGRIDIMGKVHVTSENNVNFIYTSEMPLTIQAKSKLILDGNVTFSYAPSNAAPNLFQFINDTSELVFNGGDLVSTGSLHLTEGTMRVEANAHIATSDINHDIVFGNNNAADDLKCIILRNQDLNVTKGVLSYRNVLSTSLQMGDDLARIHMFENTQLRLWESLDVRPGRIEFNGNTVMAIAAGKQFTGSLFPFGRLTRLFNLT
jgi:6-phosphogluconolactonase (cycloisomerase 2 family)